MKGISIMTLVHWAFKNIYPYRYVKMFHGKNRTVSWVFAMWAFVFWAVNICLVNICQGITGEAQVLASHVHHEPLVLEEFIGTHLFGCPLAWWHWQLLQSPVRLSPPPSQAGMAPTSGEVPFKTSDSGPPTPVAAGDSYITLMCGRLFGVWKNKTRLKTSLLKGMLKRLITRGVTVHLAHETRRITRLGPRDETSRKTYDVICRPYPINNEHKCTLMNTNVIKHVNMVIIITFNIWHLTYIKFTLDLPRVR